MNMETAAIDGARLWRRHAQMAEIGATPGGGVNRQALTSEDARSRALLLRWAHEKGFASASDAIGNLFVRRPGRDPGAEPVLSGSHLDTQPTGGRFDGVYGVLAAFEVLEALEDAGVSTRRPVEVVVWTNEEGSRFSPTTMGSAVFTGALGLGEVLRSADSVGVTVIDALRETQKVVQVDQQRSLGFPVAAYVEAHIEQGPELERTGTQIGVVTGIQGLRQFEIEVRGTEGHAGTTPRSHRKDALAAAVAVIGALTRRMADDADTVRFTVGRLEVLPGSPNTIPGRVHFTVDLRHPDAAVLDTLGDCVADVCQAESGPCSVEVRELIHKEPIRFEGRVIEAIRAAAATDGVSHRDLVSGATHDAAHLAGYCPSGMIFVPCEDGISHNEAESATPEDLAAGARVLLRTVLALAGTC